MTSFGTFGATLMATSAALAYVDQLGMQATRHRETGTLTFTRKEDTKFLFARSSILYEALQSVSIPGSGSELPPAEQPTEMIRNKEKRLNCLKP